MKLKKPLLLLILPIFLTTSCIEIVEETTVNADKSGNVKFYLDIGGVGGFFNSVTDYIDNETMNQIKESPGLVQDALKEVEGISNIKNTTKEKNGFYGVSFDFKSNKDLNNAYHALLKREKKWYEPKLVKVKKHKVKKMNIAPILRYFFKKQDENIKDKQIFKYITYKSIYHLPADVKKVKNEQSKIEGGKTVTFQCTIEELLTSDVNIGNKIKF